MICAWNYACTHQTLKCTRQKGVMKWFNIFKVNLNQCYDNKLKYYFEQVLKNGNEIWSSHTGSSDLKVNVSKKNKRICVQNIESHCRSYQNLISLFRLNNITCEKLHKARTLYMKKNILGFSVYTILSWVSIFHPFRHSTEWLMYFCSILFNL